MKMTRNAFWHKRILRTLAVLAAAAMAGASLTACGDAADGTSSSSAPTPPAGDSGAAAPAGEDYSEKLSFKVFSLDYPDGFDNYPLVTEANEKFNVDFEVQQVAWDNWDETTRTLAATDSLPEVLAWYNLLYGEYKNYAEQGILKALPDDLSAYPEIQKLAGEMDVAGKLQIDGKLYAFPKKNNNQPFNKFRNQMVVYRRDWAKAMGHDYAPVQELSYEEYVAYLKELKEKDPGGLGDKLIPMDYYSGGLTWNYAVGWWNKRFDSYYQKDGAYVWGGRDAETLQGIQELKKLYDDGLLMKDSYADKASSGSERFSAGRVGVWYGDCAVSALTNMANNLKTVDPSFQDEDLGAFVIRMPDGKFHAAQMSEWWAAFAFSHSCSDEIMSRWMSIGNWLMEEEQVEKYAYGVPDEDWTKAADGAVTINWTAEDIAAGGTKNYITNQRMFQKFFMLEGADQWLEGNPAIRDYLQNEVYKGFYEYLGAADEKGEVLYTPLDYDVDFFSGPNKDQYGNFSTDVQSAVIQAVVSGDAETSWNGFLAANQSKIDSVLEELNAGILGK